MTNFKDKALDSLISAIDELTSHNPNMPVRALRVLLEVARRPGQTSSQLMASTGCEQSSISRTLSSWSDWTWRREPGPGYIATVEDPFERRRKIAALTDEGESFVAQALHRAFGAEGEAHGAHGLIAEGQADPA